MSDVVHKSDLVEQLRDNRERFMFQGSSVFALWLADEIERLRKLAEYAKHLEPCALRDYKAPCFCGLAELIKENPHAK